jgi:hypothetical protein
MLNNQQKIIIDVMARLLAIESKPQKRARRKTSENKNL